VRNTGRRGRANIQGKDRTPLKAVVFFAGNSEDATQGIGVLRIMSTGSRRTYRDKVDNTVVVGNILMNVHG
jgi:hypothetical protein